MANLEKELTDIKQELEKNISNIEETSDSFFAGAEEFNTLSGLNVVSNCWTTLSASELGTKYHFWDLFDWTLFQIFRYKNSDNIRWIWHIRNNCEDDRQAYRYWNKYHFLSDVCSYHIGNHQLYDIKPSYQIYQINYPLNIFWT